MAGDDRERPTVGQALSALNDWIAEQGRVTQLLQAEIERAKGPTHHDDPPSPAGR